MCILLILCHELAKGSHFQFHKIMLKCMRLCLHSKLWKSFGSETSSCCDQSNSVTLITSCYSMLNYASLPACNDCDG